MANEAHDYKELVSGLSALIFRHDPLNLRQGTGVPADEYEAEAGAIASKLSDCADEDSFLTVVWSVFQEHFGEESIGPREAFAALARDLWTHSRSAR